MNAARIEKIIENKYSLLLVSLLLLITISPLTSHSLPMRFTTESILSTVIIVTMLRIVGLRGGYFFAAVVLAVVTAGLEYLALFVLTIPPVNMATCIAYMVYLGLTIFYLLGNIFSEKRVTTDTIKGSISVYLIIGVWFQLLYSLIWAMDKDSFIMGHTSEVPDFFYFSFTTMTTLGYGDVLPKANVAKIAAMMQVITGQLYLAILVARLVGLHISHSEKRREGAGVSARRSGENLQD